MKRQYLAKIELPDTPGIYIFRDYKKRPLYIGRATSLKDRTRSYFAHDLIETRGPRIIDMVTKSKSLTIQVTGSVLEAIILESVLIKRYQPFYNVDEKDDKSSQYVVITDELWPRVFLARARDLEQSLAKGRTGEEERARDEEVNAGGVMMATSSDGKMVGDEVVTSGNETQKLLDYKIRNLFGPFTESGLIKEAMKILRKMFPFRDKKSTDKRHEDFYRAIGRSPDKDGEEARKLYLKTIDYLTLFFQGDGEKLRKQIERDMNESAKALRFEEAGRAKRLLYALDHINDIALIKKRADQKKDVTHPGFRIEAYDIAHLSGTNVVGVMTVSVNGEFAPSEYRKFKISREKNDDVAGLTEILMRRLNHTEWTHPDIIVVDGGDSQLRAAQNVLKTRRINIPVVAVTKDDKHKAVDLIGNRDLAGKYKDEIVALNTEAHRFAIKYHKALRTGNFL